MNHKCDGCKYKSWHREMGFASMGVCTKTTNLVEAVNNYNAEKCPYRQTKADRIRSMGDEELAELLAEGKYNNKKIDMDEICYTGMCPDGETCVGCMLKWLKKSE